MNKKIFGFVGIESYDLIFYLASTLVKLNPKVLLVDNSLDKSLMYCLSDTLPGKKEILEYNTISITSDHPLTKSLLLSYDWIFCYFGMNLSSKSLQVCNNLVIVTDLQIHNYARLRDFCPTKKQNSYVIIRDMIGNMSRYKLILEELSEVNAPKENVLYLPYDSVDYSSRIDLQHNTIYKFNKCSSNVKEFIFKILSQEYEYKALKNSVKIAEKGA